MSLPGRVRGRSPGGVEGGSGGVRGALGMVLGVMEWFGFFRSGSGGRLGVMLGRLAAVLGRSGAGLGSQRSSCAVLSLLGKGFEVLG